MLPKQNDIFLRFWVKEPRRSDFFFSMKCSTSIVTCVKREKERGCQREKEEEREKSKKDKGGGEKEKRK